MELPFYLRILPPEALEVLAYYRRLDHNIAYANIMMAATGLSERGFGKAIRRLVTKGYLVLDGDQRYRLTEHGQRAVDDLPDSMGVRGELSQASEVEHVPLDNTDTFESLFTDSTRLEAIDPLFDEPVSDSDVDAASFLTDSSFEDDPDAIARLFANNEDDEDDLFAEMNDEDAAAFNAFFGGADESAEPAVAANSEDAAESEPEAPAVTEEEAEPLTNLTPSVMLEEPTRAPEAPDEFSLDDLFAGMDEALPAAIAPEANGVEQALRLTSDDAINDGLFEWLAMDDSPAEDNAALWENLAIAAEGAATPAAEAASRIVERRLMVALPQPLLAEQAAHITVGFLPGEGETLAEPVQLTVRMAVLNGEPSSAFDFPMLLTNGLTRQDVTITPGRYQQVRLRVRVYQMSDETDEAILCGGLYVDADVVEAADRQQTPVAFGANTHFVLNV